MKLYCIPAILAALSPTAGSLAAAPEEVVVTATRTEQTLLRYPGSVSRVTPSEIDLVGSTHHSEIMNRAAGTLIQRNSGQESLTAIRSPVLTGPGSCGAFLFLENSVPIRPVGFCNVNELFEVNSEQARAIEILRGPASALYGSSAMHGAINVIQPTPAELPATRVAMEAGPDEYYRGKLAWRRLGTGGDIGVQFFATHDGGWRDASGLDEQKLTAAYEKVFGATEVRLHLAATHLNQETAGFIQGFNAYRVESIAKSNANPEAFRDAHAVRLTGEIETPLSSSSTLSIRPYLRSSRMEFLQHFLVGKPLEENGQDSLGVLSALSFKLASGAHIVTGLDLEFADSFLLEDQKNPTTEGTPAARAIRPQGRHYDYEVQSTVAAVYGHLEQPLGAKVHASLGARLEYVQYDYDNRMRAGNTNEFGVPCAFGGCLFNRPADREDDFTNFTPKLGLTYSVTDAVSLYASATRGYRAPDTSEMYRLQRQQSVAALDAERLDNFEIGTRGQWQKVQYSLSVYAMRKDNVIFRDANAFNVADGRTKHRGLEYEIAWQLLPSLNASAYGTYAEHTYDFTRSVDGGEQIVAGRDIDTAPRHVHGVTLNWQFLPAAGTELEWQSMGSYFVDAANANRYEGHDILNLRTAWEITPSWQAIFRINNLTDEKYADRADFAFGNYRYFPGRERSVFVEVRYEME